MQLLSDKYSSEITPEMLIDFILWRDSITLDQLVNEYNENLDALNKEEDLANQVLITHE